jgi:hypothetical protein
LPGTRRRPKKQSEWSEYGWAVFDLADGPVGLLVGAVLSLLVWLGLRARRGNER